MESGEPVRDAQVKKWRQFGKHWIVVFILGVLAALVVWSMLSASSWLQKWQENRLAKRIYEKFESVLREDKYGGETPEETMDLFIAALEKEDIELASKYFVQKKQESWRKTLGEYGEEGLLKDFAKELENNKTKWQKSDSGQDPSIVQFNYSVLINEKTKVTVNGEELELPSGNYANRAIFEKYPSGIWKISVL